MTPQPRVSEVFSVADARTVLIETSAPKRRPRLDEYAYRQIPALPGERAVEFRKADGTVYHVRYDLRWAGIVCDCPGGAAHDYSGRPQCKHAIATMDLINAELLPAA